MKKVAVGFTCQACESKFTVQTRRPTWFSPAVVKIDCKSCASKYVLRFERKKNLTANQLVVYLAHSEISNVGNEIIIRRRNLGSQETSVES
jgi:hypothetical protein